MNTQYVRFRVGWKDMETPEEKREFIKILVYYFLMVFFEGLCLFFVEKGSWQAYAFSAGIIGFGFCTYLQINYVIRLYVGRMDPTKDLDDCE